MIDVAKFLKNHIPLCICTLGLAVVGYLGYHAVCLLINKCSRTEKISSVFQNRFTQNPSSQWWTRITQSPEFIDFKSDFKKNGIELTESNSNRFHAVRKLKALYTEHSHAYSAAQSSSIASAQSFYTDFAGKVVNHHGHFGLWMPGMALLATYLAEKKGVEGLYVCETLEALSNRLSEIINNPTDQRCAFIVGSFNLNTVRGLSITERNFPSDKMSVCVEKKDGIFTIALLDSSYLTSPIQQENLLKDIWEQPTVDDFFNHQELVLRAILKSCRAASTQARLLVTEPYRQKRFGDEIYALQDSVAFLKEPNFFNRIVCKYNMTIDSNYSIESITTLPPEHMIGTQDSDEINAYRQAGGQFDTTLVGRTKTLQQYLNVNLLPKKANGNEPNNQYITKKFFKYHNLAFLALKYLQPAEIQTIVAKTLVR